MVAEAYGLYHRQLSQLAVSRQLSCGNFSKTLDGILAKLAVMASLLSTTLTAMRAYEKAAYKVYPK
jgi:hypothetical protein